jgi:hypothetical protein
MLLKGRSTTLWEELSFACPRYLYRPSFLIIEGKGYYRQNRGSTTSSRPSQACFPRPEPGKPARSYYQKVPAIAENLLEGYPVTRPDAWDLRSYRLSPVPTARCSRNRFGANA